MTIIKLTLYMLIVAMLSGCWLRYIDAPSVQNEDRWVKNGWQRNEIYNQLKQCGLDNATWDVSQQVKTDKCMLSQGFIFIDSPYGKQGALCIHPDYNAIFPSCQSLKNHNN